MPSLRLVPIVLALAAVVASPAHASRLWGGGDSDWWEQEWDWDWEEQRDEWQAKLDQWTQDWEEHDPCDSQLLSFFSSDCKEEPRPSAGVPEPSAALVFGIGFAVVATALRRRQRR